MDDGAFLAVKLLGELANSKANDDEGGGEAGKKGGSGGLAELIADLEEPEEYGELRLKVKAGHDRAVVAGKCCPTPH